MASVEQGDFKLVSDALKRLLQLDDAAFSEVIKSLREHWREQAIESFWSESGEISSCITEIDEACHRLSRLRQRLRSPKTSGEVASARSHFYQKNYHEALLSFQSVKELNYEDCILAATAAIHLHQYDKVHEYVDRALCSPAWEFQGSLLKAMALYAESEFRKAWGLILRAKKHNDRHPLVLKYHKLLETAVSKSDSTQSSVTIEEPKAEIDSKSNVKRVRRWVRKPVRATLVVNDVSQVTPVTAPVLSLSAGGCLVADMDVPEDFQFCLDLGSHSIWGQGQKIYEMNENKVGVRFTSLTSWDEDTINRIVSAA